MGDRHTKFFYVKIQVILWLLFYLVWLVYGGIKWRSYSYAALVSLICFFSYAMIIYGNSLWIQPAFYKRARPWRYVLLVSLFFICVSMLRLVVENILLFPIQQVFYNFGIPHLSLVFITNAIALLVGILLHIAKNYIGLLKKQEEMKTQQLATQLDLLKQQVQPHFLFNTLNNIYSLANAKSDNTKVAIALLADMMRYFTEDAPKERVPIQKEIDFIKNYISIEQLRMVHPVHIETDFTTADIQVPTMLLMPFVENLFKHGIDKSRSDNEAVLTLSVMDKQLQYSVKNKVCEEVRSGNGLGLSNLEKRLYLLYGDEYELQAKKNETHFEAYLEIPI